MKTNTEYELLQAIHSEMQELRKALKASSERRIGRIEFAKLLNIEMDP